MNKDSDAPIEVLGSLLEDLLEVDADGIVFSTPWVQAPESASLVRQRQDQIHSALRKEGLVYSRGGKVGGSSATPTLGLREMIQSGGLSAVAVEMERSLQKVDSDPNAAVHYAANVLEASLKAYLVQKDISFNDEGDQLNRLWELVRDAIGLNPKDLGSKDLKKIASGLNNIVDGTTFLRKRKSGAHGRTEEQLVEHALRPRQARLVIHSAHTLAMYVQECLQGDAQKR